jgi:hypothetical protein
MNIDETPSSGARTARYHDIMNPAHRTRWLRADQFQELRVDASQTFVEGRTLKGSSAKSARVEGSTMSSIESSDPSVSGLDNSSHLAGAPYLGVIPFS